MNESKRIFMLALLIFSAGFVKAQHYQLQSPDKEILIDLDVRKQILYSVKRKGEALVKPSSIELLTEHNHPGDWKVNKTTRTSINQLLKPVVWVKSETIEDHYNALTIQFKNGLSLEWRAFNNGVAWRWTSEFKGDYHIKTEAANFNFNAATTSLFPQEDGFFSHNERQYKSYGISEIDSSKLASLPALFDINGTKIILTESNLWNYAGMWIRGGKNQIQATFPKHALTKQIKGDREEHVLTRDAYIASATGKRDFPWRILMISSQDRDILNNQLPYQLAKPAQGDFSWVKPGKVQWDWWHYNNIYGVDFKAGINNDTYKYYIDFASKYGIEYVLLDEGWCNTEDLMDQSQGIDVEELAKYAKSKNVDLILWTSWLVLDRQLDKALDVFEKWGIKGIKVDFMQRDDQDMVNYYEKVARAAAKRKMMVDFHGAYKPTGWIRTYPNVVTSEGVLGNEISKFANLITPDHTTTIPFIRMAAGPMDFTPGGMLNVQKNAFSAVPSEPMTLGTRCNQLAMYVVFESPLQMLCDMPTHYYKEPEAMEFLKSVPSIWKKTVPLDAKVGDFIAVARQAKNEDWYIGAMTDWTERTLDLKLDFLPVGKYKMLIWEDGPNADKNAKDFKQKTLEVDRNTQLKINMTTGGGYVARLIKI